jgi:phospholipase A1/A2
MPGRTSSITGTPGKAEALTRLVSIRESLRQISHGRASMQKHFFGREIAGLLLLCTCSAIAMEMPMRLEDCAAIQADRERLACYDRLAARASGARQESAGEERVQPLPESPSGTAPERRADKEGSFLAEHWELDPATKRGLFTFRPHRDNYLVATYNSSPNEMPYRPFRSLTPGAKGLSHSELVFQLGFKLKLAENPFDQPVDLWFGYTQRSFWQASNQEASSPFRETDYQPELMAVFPTNLNLLGLRMRFVNLGVVHQSNGQASTLSRSWNRAYIQAGFEHDNFTLLARVWKRFDEAASQDDNPDIIRFMGRGDLVSTYRRNGHEFSLLTRYNFQTSKGAAQLSWAFPLASHLKGYVQFFSGYGYTLIDYNAFQRVYGLGLSVTY